LGIKISNFEFEISEFAPIFATILRRVKTAPPTSSEAQSGPDPWGRNVSGARGNPPSGSPHRTHARGVELDSLPVGLGGFLGLALFYATFLELSIHSV
jgi:hypothetical protein